MATCVLTPAINNKTFYMERFMGTKIHWHNKLSIISICVMSLLFVRITADSLSIIHVVPPLDFGTSFDFMLFFGIVLLSGHHYFKERVTNRFSRKNLKILFLIILATSAILSVYTKLHPEIDVVYLHLPADALYITGLIIFSLDFRRNSVSNDKKSPFK